MLKQIDKDMAQLALKYALSKDNLSADIVFAWYKAHIAEFNPQELQALLTIKSTFAGKAEYMKKTLVWNEWSRMIYEAYRVAV